jgi:hypothetical protein
LIVDPDDVLAPVIPPEIVPIVQPNVLGVEAVNEILGPEPLQMVAVLAVDIEGFGSTVTIIVSGLLAQLPELAVVVTMYSTEPVVELLGFVSV